VIAQVIVQAARTEDGAALAASFRVTVTKVAGAIRALGHRVATAVFAGVVAGMPHFEHVAGGHSPEVYSGISILDVIFSHAGMRESSLCKSSHAR
jgi:hypothetical protein